MKIRRQPEKKESVAVRLSLGFLVTLTAVALWPFYVVYFIWKGRKKRHLNALV